MSEQVHAAKPATRPPAEAARAGARKGANSPASPDPRAALRAPTAEDRQESFRASVGGHNETGLPAQLKAGIESLSGFSMDDVRVHRGSPKPALLGALAFAQGSEIHVGPGQERHLPHEAWHVVQQKQGRVRATAQAKGLPLNDDRALEREADLMGAKAASLGRAGAAGGVKAAAVGTAVLQAATPDYGPLDASGWGTVVDVLLEPGKDNFTGSVPKVYPANWPIATPTTQDEKDAHEWTRKYFVRGHLLNEHLGGPGTDLANLTPITKSTNSTHASKVEGTVKDIVLNKGMPVHYRVEAIYNQTASIADMGGPNTPAAQQMVFNWPGEIVADWTAWRWSASANKYVVSKSNTAEGDLFIKNEGAQNKGDY